MFSKGLSLFLIFFVLCTSQMQAAWVLQGGKLVNADEVATLPVDQHYNLGKKALEACEWDEAARQFYIVTRNFPGTSYAKDSYFYLGQAYFKIEEFEYASEEFTSYIKSQNNPKLFEEAIQYKFEIAECFRNGARRRILGYHQMPKWLSAEKLAISSYDEVIATVPCHELAAKSLFAKASLLWDMGDYRSSVEALQTLIKRFPKHELALESYVLINQIYLDQSQKEFQNPDLLALAQLNLKKFSHDFPGDERVAEAESDVLAIKEVYATGLYETGQFYERLKKPEASCLYYQNAINQFPDTSVAKLCQQRLDALSDPSKG